MGLFVSTARLPFACEAVAGTSEGCAGGGAVSFGFSAGAPKLNPENGAGAAFLLGSGSLCGKVGVAPPAEKGDEGLPSSAGLVEEEANEDVVSPLLKPNEGALAGAAAGAAGDDPKDNEGVEGAPNEKPEKALGGSTLFGAASVGAGAPKENEGVEAAGLGAPKEKPPNGEAVAAGVAEDPNDGALFINTL